MSLEKESCVPCRKGTPPMPAEEAARLSAEVPGWAVAVRGGVRRLEKEFPFPDFAAALAFAVRVGEMADAQDHHPEISVSWGRVRVAWWTHAAGGLHRNDFICAARTDALTAPTETDKLKKT